jgi:uncharacterized protein DUF3761
MTMRTAYSRPLVAVLAAGTFLAAMLFGVGTASASDADPCAAMSPAAALTCPRTPVVAPEAGATTSEAGATSQGGTPVAPRAATRSVVTQAPAVQQPVAAAAAANPAAASDGSYTNSSGNQVERPDSNPVGATAICNDGTYSHSQNRSGTCSGHGGVAQFLTGGTTTTSQASSSSGDQFNGQYWDDGHGHHKYGWGWNNARHCWQYAAPLHDNTTVKITQVSSVPTGGVDTGDGSYGP